MTATTRWPRRQLAGIVAVLLMIGMFAASRLPESSASDRRALASAFAFVPRSIALPGGLPHQDIREVNQDYTHIDAWISSVGAGIAMNDLDGDGLDNDLCIVDPRTDTVSVTPTPDAGQDRYAPFTVSTGTLPMPEAMAPMGCAPADLDEDGRMDLLVYFWGRTPVVLRADPTVDGPLSAASYTPSELVPGVGTDTYVGPQWNSNAVTIADFDGDGHQDVYLGNYFPDGPVLDPTVSGGVAMNDSLSNAANGGADHFFRFTGTSGEGTPTFQQLQDVLPADLSAGWVLGASAVDVDGDQLPELYLAQDHGRDAMLHNRSVPGEIRLEPVQGTSSPTLPKSKRVGADSFKGMAVDWGDLDGDGLYDLFVSNITTSFGIEESNFQFMNTAGSRAELRADLQNGVAPWTDTSSTTGTAWSGWAWDVKMGDFANSGELSIAQANGFVRGEINRWPQLQELATANDLVVEDPSWWPNLRSGDDLAGDQRLHFFVGTPDGRYVDLAPELGLDVPVPTRGIATGDSDGDGRLDLAVARQWDQPVFYQNAAPEPGASLGLTLSHADAPGSPVVGAEVSATTADGRTVIGRVDGGGGHSGKRSHQVHLGLGDATGPVSVHLTWRDRSGQVHDADLQLDPGRHSLLLGTDVEEG
ncbi:CRTAC1 family protein [Geodermatophilus maliterrae]|uniref:CRTAC1 family protein n=1 Tax=Geodermatophilus maliterrae TaxID=3162531 RepID=A0ABV3XA39_9ACTN